MFFVVLAVLDSLPALSHPASNRHLGLPPQPNHGASDRLSSEATLGMRLFYDSRLSRNGMVSCATCHVPARAFTDGRRVAVGSNHRHGTRNTPTLWNSAYLTSYFWEGRSPSLELQALRPLFDPREQGLRSARELLDVIREDPTYRNAFRKAFADERVAISVKNVARAISAFERTLIAGDSPFDRYFYGHGRHAISATAAQGFALFRGRARCATCHTVTGKYALFTDNKFHAEGVGFGQIAAQLAAVSVRVVHTPVGKLDQLITSDPTVAALGRFAVTKNPSDIGEFRTPSLRNVALTAPYMHDGGIPTLRQAVDFEIYYRSLRSKRPLILTPRERADLVVFLESLTSPAVMQFAKGAKAKAHGPPD